MPPSGRAYAARPAGPSCWRRPCGSSARARAGWPWRTSRPRPASAVPSCTATSATPPGYARGGRPLLPRLLARLRRAPRPAAGRTLLHHQILAYLTFIDEDPDVYRYLNRQVPTSGVSPASPTTAGSPGWWPTPRPSTSARPAGPAMRWPGPTCSWAGWRRPPAAGSRSPPAARRSWRTGSPPSCGTASSTAGCPAGREPSAEAARPRSKSGMRPRWPRALGDAGGAPAEGPIRSAKLPE